MRYIARFDAQAWIRDEAVSVDPQGDTEWDCTVFLAERASGFYQSVLRELGAGDPEVLDVDDVLKDDENAPDWVRDWAGPFIIWVRREEG